MSHGCLSNILSMSFRRKPFSKPVAQSLFEVVYSKFYLLHHLVSPGKRPLLHVLSSSSSLFSSVANECLISCRSAMDVSIFKDVTRQKKYKQMTRRRLVSNPRPPDLIHDELDHRTTVSCQFTEVNYSYTSAVNLLICTNSTKIVQ